VAIGSPDKAARLGQLSAYARCQVRSGYRADDEVRAEVYDAVLAEERDADRAAAMADELVSTARAELERASEGWPEPTGFERLQAAFADLREQDLVVLEAVNDHWDAAAELERRDEAGALPRGIAYFSHPDVWHAVEHGMLELNVWHSDSANVAPGDALLDLVLAVLRSHDIPAVFDEGRIEVSVSWQRKPA
jgi:hypothetical protein